MNKSNIRGIGAFNIRGKGLWLDAQHLYCKPSRAIPWRWRIILPHVPPTTTRSSASRPQNPSPQPISAPHSLPIPGALLRVPKRKAITAETADARLRRDGELSLEVVGLQSTSTCPGRQGMPRADDHWAWISSTRMQWAISITSIQEVS